MESALSSLQGSWKTNYTFWGLLFQMDRNNLADMETVVVGLDSNDPWGK
jgi:hypothetical protein